MAAEALKLAFSEDDERLVEELRVWEVLMARDTSQAVDLEEHEKLVRTLFSCLLHPQKDVVELASSILARLLRRIPPTILLDLYQAEIRQGLLLEAADARRLVLNAVNGCVGSPEAVIQLISTGLLRDIIATLADDSLNVSNMAAQFFKNVVQNSKEGREYLLSEENVAFLEDLSKNNSVANARIDELFVEIASLSPTLLHFIKSRALASVIAKLKSNDVLYKLTIIQVLQKLACTTHGYAYLNEVGVIAQLCEVLIGSDDANTFILPNVINFVGALSTNKSFSYREMEGKHHFLQPIFELIMCPDLSLKFPAMDCVARIGTTHDGLPLLLSHVFSGGVTVAGVFIQDAACANLEIVEQALCGIALILNGAGSACSSEENDRHSFYQALHKKGHSLLKMSLHHAGTPFKGPQTASYAIMQSLSSQLWGLQELVMYPGFIEFILHRREGDSYEIQLFKFSVIENLASLDAKRASEASLRNEDYVRAKLYVKDGPHFKGSDVAVQYMTES